MSPTKRRIQEAVTKVTKRQRGEDKAESSETRRTRSQGLAFTHLQKFCEFEWLKPMGMPIFKVQNAASVSTSKSRDSARKSNLIQHSVVVAADEDEQQSTRTTKTSQKVQTRNEYFSFTFNKTIYRVGDYIRCKDPEDRNPDKFHLGRLKSAYEVVENGDNTTPTRKMEIIWLYRKSDCGNASKAVLQEAHDNEVFYNDVAFDDVPLEWIVEKISLMTLEQFEKRYPSKVVPKRDAKRVFFTRYQFIANKGKFIKSLPEEAIHELEGESRTEFSTPAGKNMTSVKKASTVKRESSTSSSIKKTAKTPKSSKSTPQKKQKSSKNHKKANAKSSKKKAVTKTEDGDEMDKEVVSDSEDDDTLQNESDYEEDGNEHSDNEDVTESETESESDAEAESDDEFDEEDEKPKRKAKTPRKSPAKSRYSTPRGTPRTKVVGKTKSAYKDLLTPLASRSAPLSAASTPLELARERLHVSAVPDSLPCRENEFESIYDTLVNAIEDNAGLCLYISGVPGTGKTATVHEVIRTLQAQAENEEINPFKFVEINGMRLTEPTQAYSALWYAMTEERVTPNHASSLLDKYFNTARPNREPLVVLMDELDLLVTKKQQVMYNFFDWPNRPNARLIVIAIANTMDLPERMLSNRVCSRLGSKRMNFEPYTSRQLMQIVESRLEGIDAFETDAIKLSSMKVGSVSGDARRVLDICRRAVEILELQISQGKSKVDEEGKSKVTTTIIQKAIAEMNSTVSQKALQQATFYQRFFMLAVTKAIQMSGVGETTFGDVIDKFFMMCNQQGYERIPTISELSIIGSYWGSCKILLMDPGREELYQRIRFNVNEEEVLSALKQCSESVFKTYLTGTALRA